MNFSFTLYEQEVYSKKFETKKESESENLVSLKNNFFNEKDQIWTTQVKSWEGFGSAINRVLQEKGQQYDTNNFHNMTMLYPTFYDDSEGNKGLINTIQEFTVEQKVNLLEGEFQLFQNPEGNLSILFNGKKRGNNPVESYLLVVDLNGELQLHNLTQLIDNKLDKVAKK